MTHTTTTTLEETARAVICDIADQFEHSWNNGDGPAYAEPFADDADYITIQGRRVAGREEIAAGISEILATIYLDSTIALQVTGIRCVSPTTIVAQIEHVLDAPSGPLAGVQHHPGHRGRRRDGARVGDHESPQHPRARPRTRHLNRSAYPAAETCSGSSRRVERA